MGNKQPDYMGIAITFVLIIAIISACITLLDKYQ